MNMATGTLPLYLRCYESTRTGQPVSPTVKGDFDTKYAVDVPPEAPAAAYSTTEAKVVQRPEMQQGAAGVSADSVTSGDYVITLGRIEELRTEENEDDRPSDYANDLGLKVLIEAARELGLRFPRASVSVGANRGLRVTWSYGPREVRLVCGGSTANKSYIYAESGSEHGIECILDGSHLAQHLRWVLRES
ncbi:MAG: hypothetical protein ABSH32_32960 [Bryobacteraceae bacterium]